MDVPSSYKHNNVRARARVRGRERGRERERYIYIYYGETMEREGDRCEYKKNIERFKKSKCSSELSHATLQMEGA